MIDQGKRDLFGIGVSAVDPSAAVHQIISAAVERRPFAATALAVHGLVEGSRNALLRQEVNSLDLVTPDGQPVRWALNLLYGTRLRERVCGFDLLMNVLRATEEAELPVYFYGSQQSVLNDIARQLAAQFPGLKFAGSQPSRFRTVDDIELREIAAHVRASGARVVFVGLGCPRQEQFVAAFKEPLGIPVVAVGAAFDFFAGSTPRPPAWVQRAGLEWLMRLASEPKRLWRRYLFLNPYFLFMLAKQRLIGRPALGTDERPPLKRTMVPS